MQKTSNSNNLGMRGELAIALSVKSEEQSRSTGGWDVAINGQSTE